MKPRLTPATPLLLPLLSLVGLAGGGRSVQEDPPAFWEVVEGTLTEAAVRAELEAVLVHMDGVDAMRAGVGNRLSRVNRGLAEPWITPALADELRGVLSTPGTAGRGEPRFAGVAAGVADWLDLKGFEAPGAASDHPGLLELHGAFQRLTDKENEGLALLESMSAFVELAHLLLDEALAGLSSADRATLLEGHAGFYEAWYRNHFAGAELDARQNADLAAFQTLLASPEVDRALVLSVGDALLRLAEPEFLDTLPRRLARVRADVPADAGDDVRAVVGDTPSNRVVLTGKKGSEITLPAALHIDLGGDDTWKRAAVADSPDALVGVAIDLGGDDVFESAGPGPCFAAGGAALLVDREGNDRYVSGRLGQAASILGFAALVDLEGNDAYEAEDYAQGHSSCGVGLLVDLEGDDTYTAWAFAQGGGIGFGLSALVDGEGDDRYLADLHWPDVYGNSGPDVYHGASQGYCTGIRPSVAGGLGVLLDLGDGEDRYQSGSFSQGGGYYFSLGLMYDGGGDDENFGSRYSQGFGVHQGLGVRQDAGGNDRYTCRSVAHTGMAWDEGVGFLIEEGGDDVYTTGDLSCGGAAQTGLAFCLDLEGDDVYRTGRQSQGGTGGSDYHDKPSLGVLIDLGGGEDEYSAEGRADGTLRVEAGVQVFLDAKAKKMEQAARSL